MFVQHKFKLDPETKYEIRGMVPEFGFNGLGEFIFYRTYSRLICKSCRQLVKYDGNTPICTCDDFELGQEAWNDTVIRCIEGTISIRKDWYIKNHINWDEDFWQHYGKHAALSLFNLEWSPPGRGLWAMGTDFIYERGSMALQNCGYKIVGDNIGSDCSWIMDALMTGVGIGANPVRNDDIKVFLKQDQYVFVIDDTRESWCESIEVLINSYLIKEVSKPTFDYSKIRQKGLPIRGFGGISSGPESLQILHNQINEFFEMYAKLPWYDSVMLKADIINCIGCCVVSGNTRRSAELLCGPLDDLIKLKDYSKYPYRESHGWMSNNSVILETPSDFDRLPEIAESIKVRGEPGFINLVNLKQARIGKKNKGLKADPGTGTNPCLIFRTLLLTKQGIRKLGDLSVGNEVWSQSGWTKIIKKWSTGINKVYHYRTTASSFLGTEDHRIMYLGLKVQAKMAPGIDILKGPYQNIVTINSRDVFSGLIIGDGTLDKGTIYLCVGENDYDYFTSEISKYLGVRINKSSTFYEVDTDITHLERTFNREVPDEYLYGDRDKVCSFLRGLYTANGSVVDGRVQLKASSFKLIEAVQMMLSSVGIKSYYTTNKPTQVLHRNGVYLSKQSYDLNITTDRERFQALIGFIQVYKNELLDKVIEKTAATSKNKITYDIISIEYIGEEETFDITVDNQSHTYWTHGSNVSNCGEQILEGSSGGELCTLAVTYPTRCQTTPKWLKACEYATFYASTVTLLPTHSASTNEVMLRNRRIGVDITDVAGWKADIGTTKLIKNLRAGYKKVREINKWLNTEAGIPEAIRVTTIKPGGTVPKMAGVRSGWQNPTFGYTLRRVRVAQNHPIYRILHEANVPHEPDVFSTNTEVFEFPIDQSEGGMVKPATEVGLWEQAMTLILLQREWSDNAVSNTLYFKPMWSLIKDINIGDSFYEDDIDFDLFEDVEHITQNIMPWGSFLKVQEYEDRNHRIKLLEDDYTNQWHLKIWEHNPNHEEDAIEGVLAAIAPLTKSVSVLPHSAVGVYRQMPEEGITEEEYWRRLKAIKPIDWSEYVGSDGLDEKYCDGDKCELTGIKVI